MFLKNFTLKEKYSKIKPFTIEFREGLNVIVGENGSGKSSMLYFIRNPDTTLYSVESEDCAFVFFDSEKDNPRTIDLSMSKNYAYALSSHFWSHGEAAMPIIKSLKDIKDTVIILDEPESGLSIKNQSKAFRIFNNKIKDNCQTIIATHSYVFIKSVDEVFSMDNYSWMSSHEYLKSVSAI